jgi:hypothetical protein
LKRREICLCGVGYKRLGKGLCYGFCWGEETEVKMRCLIKGAEKLQEEKELTLVEDGDELVEDGDESGWASFCYRNWEIEFRMKT